MPLTQGFLERCVQGFEARVGAILQVLGQQVLVLFDNLVDQGAMGGRNRLKIRISRGVL